MIIDKELNFDRMLVKWDSLEALEYDLQNPENQDLDFELYYTFDEYQMSDKFQAAIALVQQYGKSPIVRVNCKKAYLYENEDIEKLQSINAQLSEMGCEFKFSFDSTRNDFKPEEMLIAKNIIDKVVNDINTMSVNSPQGSRPLSPVEKLAVLYNFTANREYKENQEDKAISRNWIGVLTTEYAVCVGYASLFQCLCDKTFGVDSKEVICVEQGLNVYDANGSLEGGHENNAIYVKDDIYNIEGVYYCDACWDCVVPGKAPANFDHFLIPFDRAKNMPNCIIEFKDEAEAYIENECNYLSGINAKFGYDNELDERMRHNWGYATQADLQNKYLSRKSEAYDNKLSLERKEVQELRDSITNDLEVMRVLFGTKDTNWVINVPEDFAQAHPDYVEKINIIKTWGQGGATIDKQVLLDLAELDRQYAQELDIIKQDPNAVENPYNFLMDILWDNVHNKQNQYTPEEMFSYERDIENFHIKEKLKQEHPGVYTPQEVPNQAVYNGAFVTSLYHSHSATPDEAVEYAGRRLDEYGAYRESCNEIKQQRGQVVAEYQARLEQEQLAQQQAQEEQAQQEAQEQQSQYQDGQVSIDSQYIEGQQKGSPQKEAEQSQNEQQMEMMH